VPKDYRLVGDPEGFTSHIGVGLWDSRAITRADDNPDNWFPQDASSFDFQVGGTTYLFSSLTDPRELKIGYWHIPAMTIIASLAVLVIGIVLVRFSLEAKVFSILVLVFAVLFVGLFSPSITYSWLLAARLGIAGVVALWLVVWLLHVRRTGWPAPTVTSQAAPVPTAAGTGTVAGDSPFKAAVPDAVPVAEGPKEPTDETGGGRDEN
jgi:hypothetical protein